MEEVMEVMEEAMEGLDGPRLWLSLKSKLHKSLLQRQSF